MVVWISGLKGCASDEHEVKVTCFLGFGCVQGLCSLCLGG